MLIYGWKSGLAFTFGEVESGCEHESFCEASHRHSVYWSGCWLHECVRFLKINEAKIICALFCKLYFNEKLS